METGTEDVPVKVVDAPQHICMCQPHAVAGLGLWAFILANEGWQMRTPRALVGTPLHTLSCRALMVFPRMFVKGEVGVRSGQGQQAHRAQGWLL